MAKKNYFELLNQPQTYAVDSLSLQKAKNILLAKLHPDRFVNAGPVEKRLAQQLSVQVNEAYQTLDDDVKRAVYLCKLNGVDPMVERTMDAAFLEKQMTWRVILDDDDTSDFVRAAVLDEIFREEEAIEERLTKALDVDHDYKAAAAATRELIFVEKLINQTPH